MNFQGRSTYQTNIGAVLSILTFLFIAIFSMIKLLKLVNYEQPDFIVNTVFKDMYNDYPEPFYAPENRFEFAVSFLSIRPYMLKQHDPRIGQINMRRVQMTTDFDEIRFEKFPYHSKPCDPEVNFTEDKSQEFFSKNITLFTCLDNSELYFQGTQVSKQTSYLHMELNKCEEHLLR